MNDIKYLFKDKVSLIAILGSYISTVIVGIFIFPASHSVTESLTTRILLSAVPFIIFSITFWGSLIYLTRADK